MFLQTSQKGGFFMEIDKYIERDNLLEIKGELKPVGKILWETRWIFIQKRNRVKEEQRQQRIRQETLLQRGQLRLLKPASEI